MKVLFFGLGSVGARHLRLMQKKYPFEYFAYRSSRGTPFPGVKETHNMQEALDFGAQIAFITNPTHLHIDTAIRCLKAGVTNLFIEKPISHSMDHLKEFVSLARSKKALVYVGYSMRFHPVLVRLKEILDQNHLRVFYARTKCSTYLPSWRPGLDYSQSYSAKSSEGGGVLFDLIHEFDYNEWLFGNIQSLKGVHGKISELRIDSDDFCDISVDFQNGIQGHIHLDYFGIDARRELSLFSDKAEVSADLIRNEIRFVTDSNEKKETFLVERDDYFESQLNCFIQAVCKPSKEINNLERSVTLLEKILSFQGIKE